MLDLLGILLKDQPSAITKVTKNEAEKLIRDAIIAYRQTSSLNKLSLEQVRKAINRIHDKVYSDVSTFFDKEIAEQSLMAISQTSLAVGSMFTAFPIISVIADGVALATMAAALGLEIDLEAEGGKIVAEANGMKISIDKEPELAPARVWNDARSAELLTLGKLNAGMSSYRGDSSLYSLIFATESKTPNLNDDQLFAAIKQICIDTSNLSSNEPELGDKLFAVISAENDAEIRQAAQRITIISQQNAQLYASISVSVVFGAKLAYNIYKNYDSIKTSWNAIHGGTIPEGMTGRWTKTMSTCNKISAGVGAVAGIFGASIEIWSAIKTAKEKENALKTIDDNRDSIVNYYDSLLSHVH